MVEQASYSKLIGTACGNYRLQHVIHMHKLGPMFLAETNTNAHYLLHLIDIPSLQGRAQLSPDARLVFLDRFQQEANRVASLRHPHILPLLDYGTFHGIPYLVYPHATLTSLRSLLSKQGATDLYSVGRYLEQITSALSYAHAQGVLHRNLSTQCIYLQANRQLAVAEFGLLRIAELSRLDLPQQASTSNQLRSQQGYLGSSESSAPEQVLGKPIDRYADIYALGAVLYRLLTGHAPFEGKTREDIARQHLYALIPPISTWRAGLPVDLDHIIAKAMAKEPTQRFHNPEALLHAYRQIATPDEIKHSLITTTGSLPIVSPKTTRPLVRKTQPLPKVSVKPALNRAQPRLSRRRFFAVTGMAGTAAAVAAVVVGTHILNGKTPLQAHNTHVLAHVTDLPPNTAMTFPLANQRQPGLLIHLPDQRFVAFDSTCTHQGCAVTYNKQNHLLECPCHDAAFDPANNATVLKGPPPRSLTALRIVINPDGTIVTG